LKYKPTKSSLKVKFDSYKEIENNELQNGHLLPVTKRIKRNKKWRDLKLINEVKSHNIHTTKIEANSEWIFEKTFDTMSLVSILFRRVMKIISQKNALKLALAF